PRGRGACAANRGRSAAPRRMMQPAEGASTDRSRSVRKESMANFDALIFDCDGVLVNREQIAQEIERNLLAAAGMQYPQEEFSRRFSGVTAREFRIALAEDARTRFGVPVPPTLFDD